MEKTKIALESNFIFGVYDNSVLWMFSQTCRNRCDPPDKTS